MHGPEYGELVSGCSPDFGVLGSPEILLHARRCWIQRPSLSTDTADSEIDQVQWEEKVAHRLDIIGFPKGQIILEAQDTLLSFLSSVVDQLTEGSMKPRSCYCTTALVLSQSLNCILSALVFWKSGLRS